MRQLLTVKHGFPFLGEYFSDKGQYIVLTPGNFFESGGFKRTIGKEKFYNHDFPHEYLCKKGNLIVAMTEQAEGLLGSTAIIPENDLYLHNQRIGLITENEDIIDKLYLYYLFMTDSVRKQIRDTSSGTKVKHTSPERIYDVTVFIPPKDIQVTNAELLYKIDRKIELNNRINTELEAMAKTIYNYWFTQFDFPNAEGKPYKSSGGKMVWNKALRRNIPNTDGWSVGSLLDIAEYTNGLPCQKFRPTGSEFLRVIKIREMDGGFSVDSELVRHDVPSKVIIENGDILFSWSASLKVQIWTGGRGVLNQHIFKVTSNNYPKSFYYHQILNYLQHFKMMAENRKTTMGHITREHLEQSRIAIPPKELTLEFEKKFSPILDKIISNSIENQKLLELRKWLLPMLMNNQVTIT